MSVQCCEFVGAPVVGDTAAVIRVESGSPNNISGITFYAEGCDNGTNGCSYTDTYEVPPASGYCDATEGGTYPDATITDFSFTIIDMPPNSILTVDAAEQSVTLTDNTGNTHSSQLDVLEWAGLFEWIAAAKNGCQKICADTSGATLNGDTLIEVTTYDREL